MPNVSAITYILIRRELSKYKDNIIQFILISNELEHFPGFRTELIAIESL